MSDSDDSGSNGDEFRRAKRTADVQRLRVERLMKNPDKPAHVPEPPKAKAPPAPAEYVRFYMGSSAGAGSGEFHIYRNLRRKEQNRMKFIEDEAKKDALQDEFAKSMSEKRKTEEDKTARNRAKRQKKKAKLKNKPTKTGSKDQGSKNDSSSSESDDERQNSVNNQQSEAISSQDSKQNSLLPAVEIQGIT